MHPLVAAYALPCRRSSPSQLLRGPASAELLDSVAAAKGRLLSPLGSYMPLCSSLCLQINSYLLDTHVRHTRLDDWKSQKLPHRRSSKCGTRFSLRHFHGGTGSLSGHRPRPAALASACYLTVRTLAVRPALRRSHHSVPTECGQG